MKRSVICMFNKKLKEYKEKQAELEAKMQSYTDADENFYYINGKYSAKFG